MTEKRYLKITSSIDYYLCVDTETNEELTKDDMVDRLNEQNKQIKYLKDELCGVTSALIYETSTTNIHKDIEEAKKEIYGDNDD